ncbi:MULTISPECIES: hypothetical protein [Lactobacillaceae]|uniref:hypothetical protein n=1 Tax=Lactobacillaceae TaxID=33958 RepID=UPI0014576478|nr:hypothetical protein [Lactobacillus sp. HBUAS51381]NLR09997.1 hypothetical protein [Lactobacillus sp. HBUAS51381]
MKILLFFFRMILQDETLVQTDAKLSFINVVFPATELTKLSSMLTMLGTNQTVFALRADNNTIFLSVKSSENPDIDSKMAPVFE